FTSTAARIGLPNHVMISAAKGAVEGLTKALAADLARVKVRVNAIAPGLVDTSLGEQITSNERALEASIAMHPLGRIAKPEEVASLASYLLSDDAEFITGQIIAVDGGLSSIKTM
ncbi:MAG: SDR family oxidoreductase, partial [Fimbriimonadaceae bacterium]